MAKLILRPDQAKQLISEDVLDLLKDGKMRRVFPKGCSENAETTAQIREDGKITFNVLAYNHIED
jgi:hypothetical protein